MHYNLDKLEYVGAIEPGEGVGSLATNEEIKMRIKITFKEQLTFSGIPQETFKKGDVLIGKVERMFDVYILFLPDDAERMYSIPLSAIELTKLEDK